MKTALFLKTYAGDHEWLPFCLRSIQKFGSGYSGVYVVSENAEQAEVVNSFGFTFIPCTSPERMHMPGYLHQQAIKMEADRWIASDHSHIVFIDSDCIFNEPHTPDTWCVQGKPRLVIASYAHLNQHGAGVPWQGPTSRALGFRAMFETMRCHPNIYNVRTLRDVREHVSKVHHMHWREYIARCRPAWGTFSEFNVIGSYALRYHAHLYHVIDFTNNFHKIPSAEQFGLYSEGRRVTPERRAVLEKLLA